MSRSSRARRTSATPTTTPSRTCSCATSRRTPRRSSAGAPDGSPANGDSGDPSISAKGAVVAFESQCDQPQRSRPRCVHGRVHLHPGDRRDQAHQPAAQRAGAERVRRMTRRSRITGTRLAFVSDADNLFADDRDLYSNVYVSIIQPAFTFLSHVSRTSTDRLGGPPGERQLDEPGDLGVGQRGWQVRRIRLHGDQPGGRRRPAAGVSPQRVREQHRPRQPCRRAVGRDGRDSVVVSVDFDGRPLCRICDRVGQPRRGRRNGQRRGAAGSDRLRRVRTRHGLGEHAPDEPGKRSGRRGAWPRLGSSGAFGARHAGCVRLRCEDR